MKICVVGSGYVGLVTAVGFADGGHDVSGIDLDAEKVRRINAGEMPIYEPELDDLLRQNLRSGRLRFTTDYAEGVRDAQVLFVCVGTPSGSDGRADLSAVEASTRSIARNLTVDGAIIVIKSTVPVGTNDRMAEICREAATRPHELASNPEFLKEGAAVDDFLRPDRVLIGVRSARAGETLRELYEPFVRTGAPIIQTDPRSAEMAKYAANGMLASRISFMNEIARLCDALGADVESVRRVVGSDRRIGSSFLFPGPGYGGSCFPKDVQALSAMGRELSMDVPLIDAVGRTNEIQREYLMRMIRRHFEGQDLSARKFAVWGLAFKPRTDDVRESPAVKVAQDLVDAGAEVAVFDPAAMETARAEAGGLDGRVRWAADRYDAATEADALVLATEWSEFRRPDVGRMAELMRGRVIFDGRNVLDERAFVREGFTVYRVGRPRCGPAG